MLDESEYFNKDWKHAARRVMSPPFRDKIHQDDLWNGLRAGSLQVVATDHCAFTTKQKELGLGDFTKIPNGTGGLEDRMPVLWTYGVETGRLTMNEFVAVTSTNIARILNLYPRKGAILPGADADVTVWDPKAKKTISARSQVSVIDYNVFEGSKVTGLPRYTLSRGDVVYRDGKVQAEHGRGRFVGREPFPADARALKRCKEFTAGGRRCALRERADDGRSGGSQAQAGRRRQGRRAADAAIEISELSLSFDTADGPVQALTDINLTIARGEFVSLIGPSGCGKTTLLRVIADLEAADRRRDPRQRHDARTRRARSRAYGYVFQAPALYPWRTIARNVALPLEIMGFAKAERDGARRQGPRARQSHRLRAQISLATVRRHAAARLDRARAVVRSRSAADGRAVRRARRDRPRQPQRAIAAAVGRDQQDRRSSSPTRFRRRCSCRPRSW